MILGATRFIATVFLLLAFLVISRTSYGETCYIPSEITWTGEEQYGRLSCHQTLVDQFWDHFDFDKDDWDDGFGYHDPCNTLLPLARTFNGLYLLAYSAEDFASSTSDFSGNALRWGYPYSASSIDELDGRCGVSGGRSSSTIFGGIGVDERTKLYWPHFYSMSPAERAGDIVHEARHAGAGMDHDARDDSCERGAGCDQRWSSFGANTYEVLYLWWFAVDGQRTTVALKRLAAQRAQLIIDRGYAERPPYTTWWNE